MFEVWRKRLVGRRRQEVGDEVCWERVVDGDDVVRAFMIEPRGEGNCCQLLLEVRLAAVRDAARGPVNAVTDGIGEDVGHYSDRDFSGNHVVVSGIRVGLGVVRNVDGERRGVRHCTTQPIYSKRSEGAAWEGTSVGMKVLERTAQKNEDCNREWKAALIRSV